jgi:hypothetical protein
MFLTIAIHLGKLFGSGARVCLQRKTNAKADIDK